MITEKKEKNKSYISYIPATFSDKCTDFTDDPIVNVTVVTNTHNDDSIIMIMITNTFGNT